MQGFEWLKGIFSFSKSETRGIVVLLVIIGALIVVRFIMYSRLDRYELQTYYSNDTSVYYQSEKKYSKNPGTENLNKSKKLIPKPVDPNTATYKDLIAIGLPSRVARTLIKYREKGGSYHSPDDLFKVYGFDTSLYSATEKYLCFTPKERKPIVNSKSTEQVFSP